MSCRSCCSFVDPLLVCGRILEALMPVLFSLGQHDALEAIQGWLAQDEHLMAG